MAANETELTDDDVQPDEMDGVLANLSDGDDAAAVDTDAGDDYADVFAEDTGPPRDDAGRFAKRDADPPDPNAKPTAEATEAPSPADGASALGEAAPVDPFAEWQPFTFKADGVEATLEGIRANDTHVVIPRDVWDSEFRPKYLANRDAWQEERNGYRAQVQQATAFARQAAEERSAREARAEAVIGEFEKLMQDPDQLVAFLQDFERQAPILRAQLDAEEARSMLAQRDRAEQAQRVEAEREQLFARGTDTFEQECIALLKDTKYSGLALNDDERDELLAEIWEARGPQLVRIADRDYPEYGLRRGDMTVDRETLTELFDRRAAYLAKRITKAASVTTAEQKNAARVASPATHPQTTKPAGAKGKPAPASNTRRTAPAPVDHSRVSTRLTDDELDALDRDFASVFDE
jgi:hypothetical protein